MKTGKTPKNLSPLGMSCSVGVVQWLAFTAVIAVNGHQSADDRRVPFTPIRFFAPTPWRCCPLNSVATESCDGTRAATFRVSSHRFDGPAVSLSFSEMKRCSDRDGIKVSPHNIRRGSDTTAEFHSKDSRKRAERETQPVGRSVLPSNSAKFFRTHKYISGSRKSIKARNSCYC